jgi:hypothetical protein
MLNIKVLEEGVIDIDPDSLARRENQLRKIRFDLMNRFKKKQQWHDMNMVSDTSEHFQVGDIILLRDGDSNGNLSKFLSTTRCHGGPYQIVSIPTRDNFGVCGADKIEVIVHRAKLMKYIPSSADVLVGIGLAASAVGAAHSRVFGLEEKSQMRGTPFRL